MFVETTNTGIAEEHASAAVGLQAVLVRIDDDGVGLVDHGVGAARGFIERVGNELEIAAIRCVYVKAETVALAQREDLV